VRESSATPTGVDFSGMSTGGGDRCSVLPPANVLASLRDDGIIARINGDRHAFRWCGRARKLRGQGRSQAPAEGSKLGNEGELK
jgi:hypothetical protein